MLAHPPKGTKKLLKRFRQIFADLGPCENVDLGAALELGNKKIRVPTAGIPLQLQLADNDNSLHIYPEQCFCGKGACAETGHYLIFDPRQFFDQIGGFVRLDPGGSVTLGRGIGDQAKILHLNKAVAQRHLTIELRKGGLVFKPQAPRAHAYLAPLATDTDIVRLTEWRKKKLKRLGKLLPGKIQPLAPGEALNLLEEIVALAQREPHRPTDWRGRPGGIVSLPERLTPVLVGDLHASVDNMLVVLTQNGFLEALEEGRCCLVILGDAIYSGAHLHPEDLHRSLRMMDFLFRLKLRFSDRVFYLRGHHDSFSGEQGSGDLQLGALWESELRRTRGKKYLRTMERYYALMPYLALSRDFVACHAGAPAFKVTRDMLINIRQYPDLENALTRNRAHKANRRTGYNKNDVKRFRKRLALEENIPFITAHNPLSGNDTPWSQVDDIPQHWQVYSGGAHWVGLVTRVGGRMVPLKYPGEPLLALFNSQYARPAFPLRTPSR